MAKYGPEEFQLKNGRQVIIRHCTADDVGSFKDFQETVASETTNTLQVVGKTPPADKVRENWQIRQEQPRHLTLGVFDKSQLVGQLLFAPARDDHPWVEHVGGFAMMILKNYWGNGLGRRLLEIMEDFAIANGFTRISAMVRTQNERAVRLYTQAGYTIEGIRTNAVLIDGGYQSEYYLGKILDVNSAEEPLWTPPTLETQRLMIRPLAVTDAESIFEYARNPNVSKYTLWEPHVTVADSVSFILEYGFAYYRKQTPEPLGICFKENPDKVIGTVGCFWVSKYSKSMDLAYALAESCWGQGITVEASQALLSYCFKNYEVQRIQARCKVENTSSARVMEKLGMQFEGTLKSAIFHRERFWDMHYYAALKSSF